MVKHLIMCIPDQDIKCWKVTDLLHFHCLPPHFLNYSFGANLTYCELVVGMLRHTFQFRNLLTIIMWKWKKAHLYLRVPVQRFIYCDIRVIWPDLQKEKKKMISHNIPTYSWKSHHCACEFQSLLITAWWFGCLFLFHLFVWTSIPSYLPPHNSIINMFGPFDEDICCFASHKGRVMFCLIAWDGWILGLSTHICVINSRGWPEMQ